MDRQIDRQISVDMQRNKKTHENIFTEFNHRMLRYQDIQWIDKYIEYTEIARYQDIKWIARYIQNIQR